MALRNETVAVLTIVLGVVMVFLGVAAWNLTNPAIAFTLGLGLGALGAIMLIGGIVIAITSRGD